MCSLSHLLFLQVFISLCLLFNEGLVVKPALQRVRAFHSLVPSSSSTSLRDTDNSNNEVSNVSPQVARLNAMAAKLRAEAAELEAEQQKMLVDNLTNLFRAFDTNKDGKISLDELKLGLSKALREAINEEQAKKILQQFDTSGDGALQLDEFQGIETFRSRFDKILSEERKSAQDARNAALEAKEAAKKAEAISALINNKPPTIPDKLISLLPFLLPFLDVLPYGKTFIIDTNLAENPLIGIAGFLYALYQAVPFAGLIAFILFNIFSANLQLNRLVRYNIQAAIFLDIALILPGIVGSLVTALLQYLQSPLPPLVNDICSTTTFLLFSTAILYSIGSSITGREPDKLPFITERIKQRVPTTEEFQKMYDDYQAAMKEKEKEKLKDDLRKGEDDEKKK